MIKATLQDKELVIDILAESFDANRSVKFLVKEGPKREQDIRELMRYSFNYCYTFGNIWLNDEKTACALILHKKKTTFASILWDLRLAFKVIGITRVPQVMLRESKFNRFHPKGNAPFMYLWLIGVREAEQGKGFGSKLIKDIEANNADKKPFYLETSVPRNLPFYDKLGFKIFQEVDLGYSMYMMKKVYA